MQRQMVVFLMGYDAFSRYFSSTILYVLVDKKIYCLKNFYYVSVDAN